MSVDTRLRRQYEVLNEVLRLVVPASFLKCGQALSVGAAESGVAVQRAISRLVNAYLITNIACRSRRAHLWFVLYSVQWARC